MSIRLFRILIVASGAASLLACQSLGSRWQESAFALSDADLAIPDYLRKLDARSPEERVDDRERLGVFAHRVSGGSGFVVGLRRYNEGGRFVSDDEHFEKLTIFVPPAFHTFPLLAQLDGSSGVSVLVTQGSSAWPREACSGYVQSGELSISQRGAWYRVDVFGTLVPVGNRDVWEHCKGNREVSYSFDARTIELGELTPWLGLAAEHPYAETYPQ